MEKEELIKNLLKLDDFQGKFVKINILRQLDGQKFNPHQISKKIGKGYTHTIKLLKFLKEKGFVNYEGRMFSAEISISGATRNYEKRYYSLTKQGKDFVDELSGIDLNF